MTWLAFLVGEKSPYGLKLIFDCYPSNDVKDAFIHCEVMQDNNTAKQCKTTKWSFYLLNKILECRHLITVYIRVGRSIYNSKL